MSRFGDNEVQVGYKLVVEGVVGVSPTMRHSEVEEILGDSRNISLVVEGLTQYAPDMVELEWLDTWDGDGSDE